MSHKLQGQVAVVTGASKGIGAASAEHPAIGGIHSNMKSAVIESAKA
jgi:NADP-dependent 3-hydroxy acid dehydrogenase YdfG